MLAYRLLNLVTDYSFRVRALNVTYIDTVKVTEVVHPAFVIEHKRSVAKRLDLSILKVTQLKSAQLQPSYTARAALHNYLIGNTDFSFTRGPEDDDCCHNTVPMSDANAVVFGLSYDFDSTGMVNPPYSAPSESLGIRRFTQRKYRGYCRHGSELQDARNIFIEKKAEVFGLIETFSELPKLNRKRTHSFVSKFYKTLESDRAFEQKIVSAYR